MHKNPEIERLRALAILLVMVTHTFAVYSLLPTILRQSWVGVDLFFVLSGYVVSRSLLRALPPFEGLGLSERFRLALPVLRSFYVRRAFRILPLAFLWMAIDVLLAWAFRDVAPERFGSVSQIMHENIAFCLGIFNYWRDNTTIQGQLWSLSVEEHFYFLLPWLLVFAACRRSRLTLTVAGIFAVVLVLRPFIPVPAYADRVSFLTYTSHRRFDQLLLGVLLGIATHYHADSQRWSLPSAHGPLLRLLLTAGLSLTLWAAPGVFSEDMRLGFGFTVYGAIALVLVALASREQGYIFSVPGLSTVLEYLGSRSYGVYFSHLPVGRLYRFALLQHRIELPAWFTETTGGGLAQFAVLLAVNLAIAEVAYRLVEAPCVRYGAVVAARGARREQRVGVSACVG